MKLMVDIFDFKVWLCVAWSLGAAWSMYSSSLFNRCMECYGCECAGMSAMFTLAGTQEWHFLSAMPTVVSVSSSSLAHTWSVMVVWYPSRTCDITIATSSARPV